MYTNTIYLDVNAIPKNQELFGKVGDSNRNVRIVILSDSYAYTASDAVVSIRVGNTIYESEISEETNIVMLPIPEDAMKKPGKYYGDVAIKKGGAVISTAPFEFIVLNSPNGGNINELYE